MQRLAIALLVLLSVSSVRAGLAGLSFSPRPRKGGSSCPDLKLCCERFRPRSCDELCKRVRVDCRCNADDCCGKSTRLSCRSFCQRADVNCGGGPKCSAADCCDPSRPECRGKCGPLACDVCNPSNCCPIGSLPSFCPDSTCATVLCAGPIITDPVEPVDPVDPVDPGFPVVPTPKPIDGCPSDTTRCCDGSLPDRCFGICAAVLCVRPPVFDVPAPGGKNCCPPVFREGDPALKNCEDCGFRG